MIDLDNDFEIDEEAIIEIWDRAAKGERRAIEVKQNIIRDFTFIKQYGIDAYAYSMELI